MYRKTLERTGKRWKVPDNFLLVDDIGKNRKKILVHNGVSSCAENIFLAVFCDLVAPTLSSFLESHMFIAPGAYFVSMKLKVSYKNF